MKRSHIIIGFTAALIALPAAAQEPGWYAGFSVGNSQAGDACSGAGGGISCEDTTTTWKLIGGYQVNRNFAVELGYTPRLASAKASGFGLTDEIKSSALELVAIPSVPIGDFSLFGKIGVYTAKTDETTNFAGDRSENNTDFTFGAGVGYQFHRNFSARLEWQRYSKVGGGDIGKEDIDALSLGLLYRF